MRQVVLIAALSVGASAQTEPGKVVKHLEPPLQAPEVVEHQLRQHLIAQAPALNAPASVEAWTAEAAKLRKRLLDDVILRGWPREWVDAPPRFEDLGPLPAGKGYRMRKLRYEIVPGFYSTAILYEPEHMTGKVPAILNVNGHVGPPGKSVEYKQKRCIQQARMGILALNLEWISFGELSAPENAHWYAAHLELTGAGSAGLFYLAMRRGLDYLYEHPSVDRARIGMTGLSGGGWQTIVLSALDERVILSIPVAGFASVRSRIERVDDIGDVEQNPTDMLTVADYPHMAALRAPRPTLLVYNAEDDCCFRGPLVKPYIFDDVRPFFALYRADGLFAWHENTDPSDHNYQADNRVAAYRFISRYFKTPELAEDASLSGEIKSYDELVVGLPKDNLTVLGLARQFASRIERAASPGPAEDRARVKRLLRYEDVKLDRAWAVGNTKHAELETQSHRLEFANGLGATAVWLKAIATRDDAPATVVLCDAGKKAGRVEVSDRINRGEQVLALDLVFFGEAAPKRPALFQFAQLVAALGERPLGLEASQLIAAVRWLQDKARVDKVRVETRGIRSQMVALSAAVIEPSLFREMVVRDGMASLRHLLDAPVAYADAADLFCLDLYKETDVDRMIAASGVPVVFGK
jgi:dienelactone hydrolase